MLTYVVTLFRTRSAETYVRVIQVDDHLTDDLGFALVTSASAELNTDYRNCYADGYAHMTEDGLQVEIRNMRQSGRIY